MKVKAGWLVSLTLVSSIALANTPSLQQTIERLVQKTDPSLNYGIVLLNPQNNQIIFKHNANQNFTPASNLKLYTDAAGLIYLGSHYRFNTQLTTDAATINKTVLQGNLYVNLSGDPSLSTQDLTQLFKQLEKYDIKHIQGNIIINNADYAHQAYGPGWMISDAHYGYGAPVSPVILNENATTFSVSPGNKVNAKAIIYKLNPNPLVKLDNQVTTQTSAELRCKITYTMSDENVLTAKGCIYEKSPSYEQRISIKNPLLYMRQSIYAILIKQGIQLHGKIELGKSPQHTKLLANHSSKDLFSIAQETLKPSNNMLADGVFLKLGQAYYHKGVTWQQGTNAVKAILKKYVGIDLRRSVLVDGSGLSRYNLVTPMQTSQLLNYLYKDFPVSFEYVSSLPISSEDGTLDDRFIQSNLAGLVRAKTGSMSGVSSLSGYLFTKAHKPLVFSIMMSGFTGRLDDYRHLQDQIVDAMQNVSIPNQENKSSSQNINHNSLSTQAAITQIQLTEQLDQAEKTLRRNLGDTPVAIIRNHNEVTFLFSSTQLFHGNKALLQAPAVRQLSSVLQLMKQIKPKQMTLAGIATVAKNTMTNELEALKQFMLRHGIQENQILTITYPTKALSPLKTFEQLDEIPQPITLTLRF